MALRRRRQQPGRLIGGRAFVVPSTTVNAGGGDSGGSFNNTSANARAKTVTRLVAVSAEDGAPVASDSKRITERIPNWLRIVMYHAGTNEEPQESLPAELHVPVWIHAETREVEQLDVDRAAEELAEYRDVARRHWKLTEAPLASVRGAIALPGIAVRETKDFVGTWRGELSNLREDRASHRAGEAPVHRPIPEKELEQRRRTSTMLRYRFEQRPKERAKVREGVVQQGPGMAASTRAGVYPRAHFDAWVEGHEISGVISAEEAARLREAAAPSDI